MARGETESTANERSVTPAHCRDETQTVEQATEDPILTSAISVPTVAFADLCRSAPFFVDASCLA